jgi:formate hydrogenlyase subunit 6/NADH:ubiquinone oxidoreductase subunit I
VRSDFDWPPDWFYAFVPGLLAKFAAKLFWIRPAIHAEMCVNCGYCVESCPVSALSAGTNVPEFDYKLCINCLCCQEVCPQHAVYQQKSPVARLLRP